MWGTLLMWTILFYYAFNNNYVGCININSIGEANSEAFILAPVTFIMGTIATIITTRDYINGK